MARKKIFIQGMTCSSCEANITHELKQFNQLHNIQVSQSKGIAEMDVRGDDFPLAEIKQKIEKLGYLVSNNQLPARKAATLEQWIYSLLIVLGIYLVYKYLKWIGALSWLDFNPSSVNFGAAFLIGIVASLSTCLVVVGAVVMSFGSKYQTSGNAFQQTIKPHLLFHFGRLVSFFVLGGLLGLVGSWLNISLSFTGWFTVLVALILIWLAGNIMGFAPAVSKIGIRMPKKSLAIWHKLKNSEHSLAPILLGAFTFFLPCGFTQSMQLLSIASGSFFTGAMTMSLFALGTTPVLFGLGLAASRWQNRKSPIMQNAIGIIIVIFGLYTLLSGLTVLGVNVSWMKSAPASAIKQANAQVIEMAVEYSGYVPSSFKLQKDVPVQWVIDGKGITGCTSDIIVPSLGIRERLKPGENIIEFTPTKAGNIAFSCGMGMVRGNFIVE